MGWEKTFGGIRLWRLPALALALASLVALTPHASAGENGPTPSDWEGLRWQDLSSARAAIICLSDEPASWCGDWWESRSSQVARAPEPAPEEEPDEPVVVVVPKAVPDTAWKALMHRVNTAAPNAADLELITLRAREDADPAAMEMLGYAFASGWGVEQNYAAAYEYYGQAFVAGASHVKPNLDQLWNFLTPEEQERLKGHFSPAGQAASL